MSRFILAFIYVPIATVFLFVCLFALSMHGRPTVPVFAAEVKDTVDNSFNFYAALPAVLGSQNSVIISGDARPYILEKFIKTYYPESPLLPYTQNLVDTADRYNLDFRLMVGIAMQESNLCKKIPEGSRNCWGLGIYGDKVWRFESYEEAIEAVGKTLSKYATKGRLQPEEIVKLYTPSSNGSWEHAVRHFMEKME